MKKAQLSTKCLTRGSPSSKISRKSMSPVKYAQDKNMQVWKRQKNEMNFKYIPKKGVPKIGFKGKHISWGRPSQDRTLRVLDSCEVSTLRRKKSKDDDSKREKQSSPKSREQTTLEPSLLEDFGENAMNYCLAEQLESLIGQNRYHNIPEILDQLEQKNLELEKKQTQVNKYKNQIQSYEQIIKKQNIALTMQKRRNEMNEKMIKKLKVKYMMLKKNVLYDLSDSDGQK